MKMKRFAVKGILIFVCLLVACAFLSGTIMSLTCARIKTVVPRMGKSEKKTELEASVYFPEKEEIKPELPDDMTYTVTDVYTRAGYTAGAGETLIKATVTGYDQKEAELRKTYSQAEENLTKLNMSGSSLRIRETDEAYVIAQRKKQEASDELLMARVAMNVYLGNEGLTLEDHEGASEECAAAIESYYEKEADYNAADSEWQKYSRYSIDDAVYTYLTNKYTYETQMREAEDGLAELMMYQSAASNICSGHDCTVIEVSVKKGDVWDGTAALVTVSGDGSSPMLRSDLNDDTKTVSKNSVVRVDTGRYGTVESRVKEVKTDTEGVKYALIDLNKDIIEGFGSLYSVMQKPLNVTVIDKSQTAYCLVPVSAVHGSGSDRYVFTVETTENSFGSKNMKVRRLDVTVVSEDGGLASLDQDISWYTLAYMEDREITDGQTVMLYTE